MFFQVNGLSISNLQKAKKDGIVTVDIIANHLTEDEDGETTLKEAFSADAVKEFLNIGVIEFWHETRNPLLTKEEKNNNLLGRPVAFRWEEGLPVVTAELTEKHPIVQTMMPHLEASNPVYAASIGGSKIVLEAQGPDGQIHKVIPKIKWDHLAIAPANMVVNREPGVNVKLLQKANNPIDISFEFDSMNTFKRSSKQFFGQEQSLIKALLAPGSVADMYNGQGAGVITKQSMEKTIATLTFSDDDAEKLIDTMIRIKNDELPLERNDYYAAFPNDVEFADKSYRLFDRYFKKSNKEKA